MAFIEREGKGKVSGNSVQFWSELLQSRTDVDSIVDFAGVSFVIKLLVGVLRTGQEMAAIASN